MVRVSSRLELGAERSVARSKAAEACGGEAVKIAAMVGVGGGGSGGGDGRGGDARI